MSRLLRGLAVAMIGMGALAMAVPDAAAGKKYRYKNNGANFAAGVFTGLVIGGIVANSARHGRYYCYNAYCNGRYYKRRYYPKPYYGPRYYGRTYGPVPYYRPQPRRVYVSQPHINYCYRKYRSYRAYDNTFQPYHGPRKQCRSPYY
ncbi:BA14K family protein [Nitratireductor sp. XY-223]|uniref:BA14K family protein n=1 Tax=Nitratireductor sp. XY-223 TaxID=2561926 RepID=UPI0010A997E1|nr:BA14K family protein [Nitratireductor sp. XY-223]